MLVQALNAQEESQRMISIRKVYQKAIVTPTHHVEQLWKDYENFENSVSRQLVNFWLYNIYGFSICWFIIIIKILMHISMSDNLSSIIWLMDNLTVSCKQAKGLVSEYQPKFNSARAVYRERKKYIDEIDWNMLAVPPTGSSKAK